MSRTPLAAVALLAACLLAACTDDDPKPDIPDPTPSAPTSTATAGSTSPTVTPTSVAITPREAVDVWLAAWTVAMNTGETQSVRDLSTPDCDSCARLIAKVEEVYEKGGRYETNGWTATRVSEAPDSVSATPSYVMQVVQAPRSLYGADGELVDEAARSKVPMRMTFKSVGDAWALNRLEILE